MISVDESPALDEIERLRAALAAAEAERDSARVLMFEAERQRDALRSRLDEIRDSYDNLLARAQWDERNAIAAYLAEHPTLGLRGTQLLDNIRAGAWRKGEGKP